MILRHLRIENFGCLGQGEWSFAGGVNLVRGPNEAGKSTLAEAIAKVLLGSAPITTSADDYRRWQSWGTDEMYVLEAEFEHAGRGWRVLRDYAAGRSVLEALDGSERLTADERVRTRLAEMVGLTQSSEQQYLATAHLRQGEWVAVQRAKDLDEVLAQAVLAGGSAVNPVAVQRELEKRHSDYARGMDRPAPRNPGAVARARELVETAKRKLHGDGQQQGLLTRRNLEEQARAQLLEAQERLVRCRRELERLEPLLEAARHRREIEASLAEARKKKEQLSQRIGQAVALRRELEEVRDRLAAAAALRPEEVRALEEKSQQANQLREQAMTAQQQAKEDAQAAEELRVQLEAAMREVPSEQDVVRASALAEEKSQAEARLRELERQQEEAQAKVAGRHTRGLFLLAAAAVIAVVALLARSALPPVGIAIVWGVAALVALVGLLDLLCRRAVDMAAIDEARRLLDERAEELVALLRCYGVTSPSALAQQRVMAIEKTARIREAHSARQARAEGLGKQASQEREAAEDLVRLVREQLEEWGVADLATARSRAEEHERLQARANQLEARLQQALEGTSLPDLEADLARQQVQERTLMQQLDQPEMQIAAMSEQEYGSLQVSLQRLREEEQEAARQVASAEGTLSSVRGAAAEALVAVAELEAAEHELASAVRQERVLGTVVDLLARAIREVRASAREVLLPQAASLLERLTLGRYNEMVLDADGAPLVQVAAKQGPAKADILSYATREQIYLALRLATYKTLWPQDGPPLLLDEPLIAFDEDRKASALAVLRELAEITQIIILTVGHEYDSLATTAIEL